MYSERNTLTEPWFRKLLYKNLLMITPRSDIRKLWEYNIFVKEYAHRASLRAALEGMRI